MRRVMKVFSQNKSTVWRKTQAQLILWVFRVLTRLPQCFNPYQVFRGAGKWWPSNHITLPACTCLTTRQAWFLPSHILWKVPGMDVLWGQGHANSLTDHLRQLSLSHGGAEVLQKPIWSTSLKIFIIWPFGKFAGAQFGDLVREALVLEFWRLRDRRVDRMSSMHSGFLQIMWRDRTGKQLVAH